MAMYSSLLKVIGWAVLLSYACSFRMLRTPRAFTARRIHSSVNSVSRSRWRLSHSAEDSSTAIDKDLLLPPSRKSQYLPKNVTFVQCPKCRSGFQVSPSDFTEQVAKMICGECKYYWYHDKADLLVTNDFYDLVDEPKVVKKDLFVMGLPRQYDDVDFAELFQDYGVSSVFIVKDSEKNSRGFGFVEVNNYPTTSVFFYYLFVYLFYTADRR